ncbi:RdgB/HAM1 family non-canonical purine NTP pyrophosphatase [Candidatus Nitrosotalea okcheonensis]|uniref:Non-canonical purine NTP pyrophosphatase n=1 Tax=Candidatus Nitrosotalea okcheonensis TaxID=1903276 RepID=A0A2H1FHW6_9ARCH|nr:RdgB/HAM1 family non-canonical purine NTP pyrophosphatase [Candidatus Nitrosotalea okcheonensis]SMH72359.1 Non-canonical purine NTP pyrophosphatase [Candidatus Nitrosotalea okcheonensis]
MLSDIFFASSNKNKFEEAKDIASEFGLKLKFLKYTLQEIQADTLEEIATHKAMQAFSICSRPVIVEDAGLFIKSLNGFPGPYSSFVFDTIGNKGILRLVPMKRDAIFRSVIAYCEKHGNVHLFSAGVNGVISKKEQGKRWGFDPIFIPSGENKTYSQLAEKNKISHRYLALKNFSNWYLSKKKSSDP